MRYYSPRPLTQALPNAKVEVIQQSPQQDWPLIWEWQVFAESPHLKSILDWRLAGYRGPIALTGDWTHSEIVEEAPWLAQDLPGIQLFNQAEPLRLQDWLAKATPLSDSDWQTAAGAMVTYQWRVLAHDEQALRRLDAPHPQQIQRLAEQLAQAESAWTQACDSAWPAVRSQIRDWQDRLLHWQAQPIDPSQRAASHAAAEQLFESLRERPLPDALTLKRVAEQLYRHWQALLQQHAQLQERLATERFVAAEQDLLQALLNWFEQFDGHSLQQAPGVLAAAESLRGLMQKRSAEARTGLLSQCIHNSVDQHLYTVSEGLKQWQRTLQAWLRQADQQQALASREADLNVSGLSVSVLPGLIRSLDESKPAGDQLPTGEPIDSAQASYARKCIVILEDNPVWAEEIRLQAERALAQFLKHYPQQRFRDWHIQVFDHIAAAESELKHAILLISDLSLPLQPGQLPQRSHGLDFLTRHKASLKGVPVIVQTTPTWFLDDQQAITALGIHDLDFVFKSDPDTVQARIYAWLKNLRQRPLFWIQTEPLSLNGVALKLSHLNQSLLRILSPGKPLTPHQIVHALVEQGHQAYQGGREALRRETPACRLPRICQDWLTSLPHEWGNMARNRLMILQTQAQLLPGEIPQAERWQRLQQALVSSHFGFARELRNGEWDFLPQALGFDWQQLIASLSDPAQNTDDQETEVLAAEWNSRVSKWISGLKRALKAQFQAVHLALEPEQLILTYEADAQSHLRGLSPQQQGQRLYHLQASQQQANQQQAGGLAKSQWRVWVVENDAVMAESLIAALQQLAKLQQLELVITPILHLEAGLEALQNADGFADLILLDLQIPLTAADYARQPEAGDPDGGYRLLNALRQTLAQRSPYHPYRVLVTSHFADDDLSRRRGLELGVPVRNYLPKGRGSKGLSWSDSLLLRLDRLLRELQTQSLQAEAEQVNLRQQGLPLRVGVIARSATQIKLRVAGPDGVDAEYLVRNQRASLLGCLLRAWPQAVSWQDACQALNASDSDLKNHRNRLRKVDIAQWPLDWLRAYSDEAVGNLVLLQERQGSVTSLRLNLSEVLDPEGLLD